MWDFGLNMRNSILFLNRRWIIGCPRYLDIAYDVCVTGRAVPVTHTWSSYC